MDNRNILSIFKFMLLEKIVNKTDLKKLFSLLFFIMTGATGFSFAQVKQTAPIDILPICNSFEKNKNKFPSDMAKTNEYANSEAVQKVKGDPAFPNDEPTEKARFVSAESEPKEWEKEKIQIKTNEIFGGKNTTQTNERFHWKSSLIESGIFLGIQHGFRLTQEKTTRELGGPFFRDWAKSVKNLRGWNDGDSPFTNNFAHPLQGGVTGRIFVNNSDRAKKLEFGKSKDYWNSRFKAFAWSAAWSTQFEFGPVSEATIGNVGLREKNGHSTAAWTDLIMTPVVGTGVVIGEDAIDRYILKNWLERKSNGKTTIKIKILRSALTPTTSFSNLLRGKLPWKRNNR